MTEPLKRPSHRSQQVSDLIRRELAMFFKTEVRDPRLVNLSITSVEVSPDFGIAKVYYTLLDKTELAAAKKALEKVSGFLRTLLAKNIKLRYVPQIKFFYDSSVIESEALSNLIEKVVAEDEKRKKD